MKASFLELSQHRVAAEITKMLCLQVIQMNTVFIDGVLT
jgi:hypothetical protein